MKQLAALTTLAAAAALTATPALAQTGTLVEQFTTTLTSAGEMPDANGLLSPGQGSGTFDLYQNAAGVSTLVYSVTAYNLVVPGTTTPDLVTMSHFHDHNMYTTLPSGATKVVNLMNGPVVKGVFDSSITGENPIDASSPTPSGPNVAVFDSNAYGVWSSADAEMPLTPILVSDLKAGNLYYNVHTADFMNGAIRGEIVPVAAPEPSSLALLAAGALSLGGLALRRRAAKA